jgi:adenylate kinase
VRLVLLGPPGVGKGTQAVKLAEHYRAPHISTGDMFREAISRGTEIGRKAKQYLDSGGLVPDDVVAGVVRERLSQPDCNGGFVLDGFPRTLRQAEALQGILASQNRGLDAVLCLTAPAEVVVDRLSGRRMCRKCGGNFHVKFRPPKREGVCDECGGELYTRADDAPDTIRERLRVYERSTSGLISYYRERGALKEVSAVASPEEVLKGAIAALEGKSGGTRSR